MNLDSGSPRDHSRTNDRDHLVAVVVTDGTLARLTGTRRHGSQVMNMPVNKKTSPSTTHTIPIALGDQ